MKKNKKLWILGAAVAIIVALSFAFGKRAAVYDKPVIKVGLIIPLSGQYAQLGSDMLAAVRVFERRLLERDTRFNYKFIPEDSMLEAARAVSAANKLISVDRVQAIISGESAIGLAINPIAERAEVVHVAIATDDNAARGRFNFTLATPADLEAQKLVRQFVKNKVKRIGIVSMNQGGYIAQRDALVREAGKVGIETVANVMTNMGDRDFRIIIMRMLAAKPDIVVVQLHTPELQIFIRQFREQNKTVLLTAMDTFSYMEDKSLIEGMYYVDLVAPLEWFNEEMRIETGRNAPWLTELQYAALDIVVSGFEYAGPDTGAVADAIVGMTFDSSIGEFHFNAAGVAQTKPSLRVVREGVAVLIEE
ncbi:MAG: ABC transporter substrate-binding protein [Alphaproteobacteria bacterium]|nr:ABC transporter substrate-binding protein [Alphaproteobacteria bacterium]